MNIAVIIIVFLYMTCGNVPNNVYGVNFLDALILLLICSLDFFMELLPQVQLKRKKNTSTSKNEKRGA